MRDNRDSGDTEARIDLNIPWWDIYVIHAKGDPDDVWYVGQSRALWQRIPQHHQNSKSQTHKPLYAHLSTHAWDYRVVEKVNTKDEARSAERRWIRHFAALNKNLFNTQGNVPDVSRAARHKIKMDSALEKGVTIIEGGILAHQGKDFVVYQWDDATEDFQVTHRGVLDMLPEVP